MIKKDQNEKDFNATCMEFAEGETNKFYIGTEDGLVV